MKKPPILLGSTVRKPLVCEFRNPVFPELRRVVVDFERRVVRFERCHGQRAINFWSNPFRGIDEVFECPLDDILEAHTVREHGRSKLLIVTSSGRAAIPSKVLFKSTVNFDSMKQVLVEVACRTPAGPASENPALAWVIIGLAIAIAVIVHMVMTLVGK